MPEANGILQVIRPIVGEVLAEVGAELVDVVYCRERGQRVLRVLADEPGGITLARCAAINRVLSERLETAIGSSEPYLLEVASPGLDRPLVGRRDFERIVGERVRMSVSDAETGQPRTIEGTVERVEAEAVLVRGVGGTTVTVPLGTIQRAKRVLPW